MESGKHPPPLHFVVSSGFRRFNALFLQVAILMCCSCSRSTQGRENVKSHETKEITCLECARVRNKYIYFSMIFLFLKITKSGTFRPKNLKAGPRGKSGISHQKVVMLTLMPWS